MAKTRKTTRSRRTGAPAVPAKSADIYELKITLLGTKPPIWRRFRVPGDIRLDRLHDVIQIVMGWEDAHMHQFVLYGGARQKGRPAENAYFRPRPPEDLAFGGFELNEHDSAEYELREILRKPKDRVVYEYDMGDCWEHGIELLKVDPAPEARARPVCLAGKGACPPEDCGGVWGYYELLEALKNPQHERHEELVEWIGEFNADAFDVEEINKGLRRVQRAASKKR